MRDQIGKGKNKPHGDANSNTNTTTSTKGTGYLIHQQQETTIPNTHTIIVKVEHGQSPYLQWNPKEVHQFCTALENYYKSLIKQGVSNPDEEILGKIGRRMKGDGARYYSTMLETKPWKSSLHS